MKRFAVFASGKGSNLQAIIKALKAKKINAELVVVFSDKAQALALVHSRKANIPTATLHPKDFSSREAFDREILKLLKLYRVDFIVLAGYMRLFSQVFIQAYDQKILNIHPALLPSFKGAHGIKDAFEAGVKVTGVTVHFVVEEMDAGAIIAQKALVINPKDTLDTLCTKIQKEEHVLYPKIIDLFARGKIKRVGTKTIIST